MVKISTLRNFSFSCALLATGSAFSQWNSNVSMNTPVCTAASWQIDLRMMDDGKSGAFITWKDYRNGSPDIYIQRVDSLGVPKWATNGVALCSQSADQSTPAICTDMSDGAIVAWSDWRSGIERDLYAQRVDGNGNVLWTTDGIVVSNKQEREHNERIVSDDAGGAIIVFEQQSQITWNWEVWAQRISPTGASLWTPGGFPVSTIQSAFLNPRIQADGKGGVIVVWQDFRNGFDYDVYAQRINAAGQKKWGPNGILVCNVTGTQTNPKVDPDSATGGCFISWTDKRNGTDYDLYAQRIDSYGFILWNLGGVAVCNAPGNQSAVDLLANPKVGGVIFTWKDARNGIDNDIYAQKFSPTGVAQWTPNGVAVCNSAGDQLNPNITGDGKGGAVIVWQDNSSGTYDIKSQRIDNAGTVQWATNGVVVGNAAGNQTSPKNISDKNGGSIYAWEDNRSGSPDIYIHRIYWNGFNVGIDEGNFLAEANCFPNPFTDEINLSYTLVQEENISIKIYDAFGKKVADVLSEKETQKPGTNQLAISADKFVSGAGVYFISMKGKSFCKNLKVIKTQ